MTLSDFITKWTNRGCDFDGFYGFQCMDLAHQYGVEVVGQDIPAAPAAKDVWTKAAPGYDKIPNGPDNFPLPGDIVIWGTGVGPYGHIAVAVEATSTKLTSFDQNWPINSLPHLQPHNYTGVLGWLHPKSPAPIPQPIPQTTAGYSEKQAIIDAYQALCGVRPTDDELNYKLQELTQGKNMVDLIKELTGDQRFKDLYIPVPVVAIPTVFTNNSTPVTFTTTTATTAKTAHTAVPTPPANTELSLLQRIVQFLGL